MHVSSLAAAALVGSAALEVAAGPVAAHAQHMQMHRAVHANTVRPHVLQEIQDASTGVPATHTVHERQPAALAKRWRATKRVAADAVLPMRIGLKARNMAAGHDRLMDMSDHRSANYGRHMTKEEVVDFFAPAEGTVRAVVDWVVASGIDRARVSLSANKQWVQFDATAAEAEQLLLTEFFEHEHAAHGTRDVAAAHYHVPRAVQPYIDYITPGIRLRHDDGAANKRARAEAKRATQHARRAFRAQFTDPTAVDVDGVAMASGRVPAFNSSTCYKYVTPACVRAQYGIPLGTTAAAGNELGVFEALAQHYSKADLDEYYANVAKEVPAGTYPAHRLVDGAEADTTVALAGSEAELDFQAAIPLIYPQGAVLFQVDDERIQVNMTTASTPYLGFWNTFFDAIDGSYCSASAYGETGNCQDAECLDPSYPDTEPGGYTGQLQCGVYTPTNVISISYGSGEEDLPAYYWRRQCDEILKLGLQGVTVVISSGDYGVGQWAGEGGNANGCAGDDGQIFYPASQATCPYALAVGATEFGLKAVDTKPSKRFVVEGKIDFDADDSTDTRKTKRSNCKPPAPDASVSAANSTSVQPRSSASSSATIAPSASGLSLNSTATPHTATSLPVPLSTGVTSNSSTSSTAPAPAPTITERATTRFGSGGGFSNYFDRPSYQDDAVAAYFASADLPFSGYSDMGNRNFSGAGTGVYRTGGRGYPDVSAVGDHYVTVLNGEYSLIGGTSLSAPIWASVLTLVNEARLAAGKSTVGFVNPTLYAHPEVFNDITAGSNPGCMTDGFPASAGWDPVTGLGSPNFPKLVALFESLD